MTTYRYIEMYDSLTLPICETEIVKFQCYDQSGVLASMASDMHTPTFTAFSTMVFNGILLY